MTGQRPIDVAMAAGSEPKKYVRQRWVEEVRFRQIGLQGETLYVTLCGADGFDVAEMIAAGIVRTEENGAIKLEDNKLIVAYERNMPAVVAVKRKFQGLKVVESDIHAELKITTPFAAPSNQDKRIFAAPVINLDYDKSVIFAESFKIPVVDAAARLAQFHELRRVSWTLLVTVNATINWGATEQSHEKNLLSPYVNSVPCQSYLSHSYGNLLEDDLNLTNLPLSVMQQFLALHLPVRIAARLISDQWELSVHEVYAYTGGGGAPMVSWVLRIDSSPSAESNRQVVLNKVADQVVQRIKYID